MPETDGTPQPKDKTEALLKQIREDYAYCLDYWREIREEAATDSQYMVGDVWSTQDKSERANRPSIVPDELSQYTKQSTNNLRQNKRAIKVIPRGDGASDEDAERRADIIRGIEHVSKAQAAYSTAYEACVETSFGVFGITLVPRNDGKKGVEPRIRRIENQFTWLGDPDAREADMSDAAITFVTDTMRQAAFLRKYPNATIRSFGPNDVPAEANAWISGENITVAEYWTRKDGKVTQYITNGVEILETNDWPGSWIPIIPVLGEQRFVNDGGKTKRVMMSLIRRARIPQKMLAFIASQEAEEFGMMPRSPFIGYKGTFESMREQWKVANKVPYAFLEVDIPTNWIGGQAPPLPERPQFLPNPQAYEVAYERWRRSLQASMGITPLPTAAQRQNEKSGVALERIQTQEAIGSYHFTDNFDRALENAGRQLNELITLTMDTPRHVPIRRADDTHAVLPVVAMQHHDLLQIPEGADEGDYLITDKGEFDVTISTGPSYQSQREEQSAFVDLLVTNLQMLLQAVGPQISAKILGLAVKMKNIGTLGDEIADLLSPPDQNEIPPAAQAAIAQFQQNQQLLQAKIAQLEQEKQAKVVENQFKAQIAEMQKKYDIVLEQMRMENDLAKAEVSTKAQSLEERVKFVEDMWAQFHEQGHELAMQKDQQAHEAQQAELAAQNAQIQQAQAAQQEQPNAQ